MRVVRAAAALTVLALLGLLVWDVAHSGHGGVAAKVDKGHTVAAPKTTMPFFGSRNGTFDLAAYRGKVVVLNFWASWCVDCKLEAKTLHDAAAKWGSNVVFVGVDGSDLTGAAAKYMKHSTSTTPSCATSARTCRAHGASRLPGDVLRGSAGPGDPAARRRADRRRGSEGRDPAGARRMRLVRVAAVAGVVALGAVLVWRLAHQNTKVAKAVAKGKIVPAPAFNLSALSGGGRVSLAALRGKAVVVNFWASDCGPCKKEMPQLQAAADRYAGKGVRFVGIDVLDFRGPARSFVRKHNISYAIGFDGVGDTRSTTASRTRRRPSSSTAADGSWRRWSAR